MSLNLEAMVLNSPEVQAILAASIPPVPAPVPPIGADLAALMRDPRYWRDQDTEVCQLVSAGFRRLAGLS